MRDFDGSEFVLSDAVEILWRVVEPYLPRPGSREEQAQACLAEIESLTERLISADPKDVDAVAHIHGQVKSMYERASASLPDPQVRRAAIDLLAYLRIYYWAKTWSLSEHRLREARSELVEMAAFMSVSRHRFLRLFEEIRLREVSDEEAVRQIRQKLARTIGELRRWTRVQ